MSINTPNQQAWIKEGEKEEREAKEAELQRLEELRLQRAEEDVQLHAVPDPASLTLVSDATLQRMQKESGQPMKGLRVIAEKGILFSEEQPFTKARAMILHNLHNTLRLPKAIVTEGVELLDFMARGDIPLPELTTELRHVVRIPLDPTGNGMDLPYIDNTNATRLLTENKLHAETIDDLRQHVAMLVEQAPEMLKQGQIVICIIEPEECKAYEALQRHRMDRLTEMTAIRVRIPLTATEFHALHILAHVLKHLVYVVFGHTLELEKEANERWNYVWAYRKQTQTNSMYHHVLLVLGKRDIHESVWRKKQLVEHFHAMAKNEKETATTQ